MTGAPVPVLAVPSDGIASILDRGQSAGTAGTGLGLAISRDPTRAIAGHLTVESRLDVHALSPATEAVTSKLFS